MTIVDLDHIGIEISHRKAALKWMINTLGPAGEKWSIKDLRFLYFFNDRDATMFILRWS